MLHIALCDDDHSFYYNISELLQTILDVRNISYRLEYFPTTAALKTAIETGNSYELLFLDVLLDGMENGIDFARYIRQARIDTDIIFVTSNREYALDGYDVSPLHYLIKPLEKDRLEQAINMFLAKHMPERVLFQTQRGLLSLSVYEIVYIEALDHKIIIHTEEGRAETISGTLNDLEGRLLSMHFIRSHKSYLVNMIHITEIARYSLTLSTGKVLPIGKSRYTPLQYAFLSYMRQKSPGF